MIVAKEKDTGTEKKILRQAMTEAFAQGQSFSLWKTPGTDEKHLVICQQVKSVSEYSLEEGETGFIFASFKPDNKKYFFPADTLFRFENETLAQGPSEFSANLTEKESTASTQKTNFHFSDYIHSRGSDFKELVLKGLEEIEAGRIEKIVPSRCKDISISPAFDLLKAFYTLCEKHPQALVSLVSSPETGTWLGATPELLVCVNAQNKFKTVALAGTLPYTADINLKTVAWTQKEIEEQALVCRYIISCFKKIRLREYDEHGPRTIIAGNVMHLKTEYEVDMIATNFPQLGSVMLKLLHPTSAVCGMPLEQSLAFLEKNEGYDRQFYSGFLGPVQIKKESHVYVNLRCMQVFQDTVRLYAGAGITADSSPEKEWEETEIKMQNIQQLIIS